MNTILETQHLKKTYGDVQAVRDVTLSIEKGDIFGFLGPNGAGKTTTIGMILGLIHRDAGTVRIMGEPVTVDNPAPLKHVGSLVGAEAATVPNLSARNNLRLIANMHHIDKQQIDAVLDTVGLTDAADRQVKGFSTGMKQRLGMAMALLHNPELLILDEPTNGLDPAGMREIRQLLLQLADEGKTVFVSSHLLNEIEQVCNRVAVLKQGKVIAQGVVDDLLSNNQVVHVRVKQTEDAVHTLRQLGNGIDVRTESKKIIVAGATSEDVIQQLVEAGIIPQEVRINRDNLEDLFLHITETA